MLKKKPRCLITGVSGLLGNNFADYFKSRFDILGLYHSNPVQIEGIETDKCDLSDFKPIRNVISYFKPNILLHCASRTDIDDCEANRTLSNEVNVLGTKYIVQSVSEKNVKLIYISTDAVYDGIKGNFSETDKIYPQNHYGLSKYEGELEVLKVADSLIFRTNIFGWNIQNKNSLGEWILESFRADKQIAGFEDAFFSSIYTMELARVLDIAIRKNIRGVFNCGSSTSCSKYEFAVKIADKFGFNKTLVNPISIDKSGFIAKRGKNLSLKVDKLQAALDYHVPTIDDSIESFYRDAKCGKQNCIRRNVYSGSISNFINYGRQWINESDIQAVVKNLRSGRITQGPKVEDFEESLKQYTGAKYAAAVNSGTSGLHIACMAAGLDPGQEGITSPITFVASANSIVYCGGKPIFADIESNTYNISPNEIEKKITAKTRVIIPVHFAGQSCNMESIKRIVQKAEKRFGHKIFIVEDASHALGSMYQRTRVGSCAFSDMTVMSFHPVKHITTAEGGVVLTNDKTLFNKLLRFRSHGITSNPEEFVYFRQAKDKSKSDMRILINPWYYEQVDLGYNYRITDLQCTLGLSQLRRIEEFRKRRREIVNEYGGAFKGIESITIPFESTDCDSNFHLYVLLFDYEKIGASRAQIMTSLKRQGIQTQVHYIPVHTQPFYQRNFKTQWGDCPRAEAYYRHCLSIPLYPAMTESNVTRVIQEIKQLAVISP